MGEKKGLMEVIEEASRLVVEKGVALEEALRETGFFEASAAASPDERKEAFRILKEAARRQGQAAAISGKLAKLAEDAVELIRLHGVKTLADVQAVAPDEYATWARRELAIVEEIGAAGLELEHFEMKMDSDGRSSQLMPPEA